MEIIKNENYNIYYRTSPDVPLLIMLCGLPGSGKSSYAKKVLTSDYNNIFHPRIHSSDSLRRELFGSEEIQKDNNKLFNELHNRIKKDLISGKDVIYDATNINKEKRISFLQSIKNIKHYSVCIVFATEIDKCITNNFSRERTVPARVIWRMLKNWNPPHYSEGFCEIKYVFNYNYSDKYSLQFYFDFIENFDQKNSYHSLSLGGHTLKTCSFLSSQKDNLAMAGFLHDLGKIYTKSKLNHKGEYDGNYHYYQHHCVGAYQAMFYLNYAEYEEEDITYIANIIYYHMHPYLQWEKSEKTFNKDSKLLGEEMISDIYLLHEADKKAH